MGATDPEFQETSPTVEVPAPEVPQTEVPAQEGTPKVEESFDWEKWDGELASLPEKARARLSEKEADLLKAKQDADDRAQLYSEMISQVEDPQVPKLREQLDKAKADLEALKADKNATAEQLAEAKKKAEEADAAVVEAKVEAFKTANAWIFDDGPVEQLAYDLTQKNWKVEHLPIILKWDKATLAKATKIVEKNPSAAEGYIAAVASMEQTPVSPAQEVVGGATNVPTGAAGPDVVDTSKLNPRERRSLVIQRQMAKHARKNSRRT